ncbi:TIGR00730 family Rossman fold protein [Fulvivirga lutimaris]|uniref:LOG family protein n=1 Tax=Fulvivirga lutimaris TaxID=1819566 RepID=UPI0012BC41B8|nr:TIGR00730 family Rossman fold protein [Fulvivirga lutimaris]MTI41938.1 TIGR00730 family Rossman fold protein [Fulvivirga lutimaris]
MKNICVFCGSSYGAEKIYEEQAKTLGQLIASQGLQLVYGGGKVGLMGVIADEVLKQGGKVIGVIPEFLKDKEVGHPNLTEMHIVKSMHERKQLMAELSDAFIAMPGGLGTLEEVAEISTWVQLELIKKPVGLLNVNGFYNALIQQLDLMTSQGFIKEQNRKNIIHENNALDLFKKLSTFTFDDYSLWSDLDKS